MSRYKGNLDLDKETLRAHAMTMSMSNNFLAEKMLTKHRRIHRKELASQNNIRRLVNLN